MADNEKLPPENAAEIAEMEAFVKIIQEDLEAGYYAPTAERGAKRFLAAWQAGCVRIGPV